MQPRQANSAGRRIRVPQGRKAQPSARRDSTIRMAIRQVAGAVHGKPAVVWALVFGAAAGYAVPPGPSGLSVQVRAFREDVNQGIARVGNSEDHRSVCDQRQVSTIQTA